MYFENNLGLEEFQEKMENFGNGILDENDSSWIGQMVKKFFRLRTDEDELGDPNPEYDEGLEPPVLDLRWGLDDPVSTGMCVVNLYSCVFVPVGGAKSKETRMRTERGFS